MLTIVQSESAADLNRLSVSVARAHLRAAIVHLNNEAQRCVPPSSRGDPRDVEDLRLIVRALSDMVDALRAMGRDPARQHAARCP